jgi:adenylyl- and sulfurtransferase ThiI
MEWNAVVTVYERHYQLARQLLAGFGTVAQTDYFNVLTMQVADPLAFLADVDAAVRQDAALRESLARVMPVTTSFAFQDAAQFEDRAREAAAMWLPNLAGQVFHVRMHRRGFKGRLSSQEEELFLDHFLIDSLQQQGSDAELGFDNPDFILALETLGQQAGMSLWSRQQIAGYPLLKLD